MALTKAQINIMDEVSLLASIMIVWKSRARNAKEMFENEGVAQILDGDIQLLPGFEGVTAAELNQWKNAMDTVATAIGDNVAGTPLTKALKIVSEIPTTFQKG